MTVGTYRYWLAHTYGFSLAVGIVGTVLAFWAFVGQQVDWIYDGELLLWMVLGSVPVAGLGMIFGASVLWAILGSIVARHQGRPFEIGDKVAVLTGRERGTVTTVYEIWDTRGEVRVDLGPEARDAATDVFSEVEVVELQFLRE